MKPDKELCEPLLAYIDYFKQCKKTKWVGGEKVNNAFTFPCPVYDDEVHAFIRDLEHSPLMNYDYRTVLSDFFKCNEHLRSDTCAAISAADFDIVLAMLASCVRGERFMTGRLASTMEQGVIYKILIRIKELCDE